VIRSATSDQPIVARAATEQVRAAVPDETVVAPAACHVLDAEQLVTLTEGAVGSVVTKIDHDARCPPSVLHGVGVAATAQQVRPGRRIAGCPVTVAVGHEVRSLAPKS
jgi:hypothetical protein